MIVFLIKASKWHKNTVILTWVIFDPFIKEHMVKPFLCFKVNNLWFLKSRATVHIHPNHVRHNITHLLDFKPKPNVAECSELTPICLNLFLKIYKKVMLNDIESWI